MQINRRQFLNLGAMSLVGSSLLSACSRLSTPSRAFMSDFRFAFVTDLHLLDRPFIDAALEQIRSKIIDTKPDFIIGGGDWLHEGLGLNDEAAKPLFRKAQSLFKSLQIPFTTIPGNRDYVDIASTTQENSLKVYNEAFEEVGVNQILDLGSQVLIKIESLKFEPGSKNYRGEVSTFTLKWLSDKLKTVNQNKPIILLSHVPLATLFHQQTSGALNPPPIFTVVNNNRELLSSFSNHNLALILQGHLHVNEFLRWRNTTFITGGALCGKWWEGEHFGTPPGFGMVTIRTDKIDWEYVPYGKMA